MRDKIAATTASIDEWEFRHQGRETSRAGNGRRYGTLTIPELDIASRSPMKPYRSPADLRRQPNGPNPIDSP